MDVRQQLDVSIHLCTNISSQLATPLFVLKEGKTERYA